ncbi:hypothetical protein VTH82DRAFT_2568 [Thermothelomyces myriococcoides]
MNRRTAPESNKRWARTVLPPLARAKRSRNSLPTKKVSDDLARKPQPYSSSRAVDIERQVDRGAGRLPDTRTAVYTRSSKFGACLSFNLPGPGSISQSTPQKLGSKARRAPLNLRCQSAEQQCA